ncbi:glycoside hydrolase superfamily [Aspergillus transmontanensis]|uniref:Beta-galactosidase n=1 Tax=Aspergillus transmontanensis TaxID=1034304 RepID=A0A5N6WAE4_9EURO|nr:glycoside hydrolase superfamily [Aspergillus transmontanensis]
MMSPWHLFCMLLLFTRHVFSAEKPEKPLQDIVTWDEYSILVRGERMLFFSGEFHPFRLPSPGLWLDVFQKIRALGYSGVSFYLMWGLLEGEPGHVRTDGVFALDGFFNAASQAGIYLLARPGPYINAEVSGGGFPGWVQRIEGNVRTTDPSFLNATKNYISTIGEIISKAQITNGGPVILFQPENEYSVCEGAPSDEELNFCLEKDYMAAIEQQFRDAGIVVPFVNNDAIVLGDWAPGTGKGAVDIYGFDNYPFGWGNGYASPENWTQITDPLTQYNFSQHQSMSPGTPFSIIEFQGGAPDPWGGTGVDVRAEMVSNIFARVFYKINYGFRVTIFNLYMMLGGTNWGNLGYSSGYTSYDVGAAIIEDRQITRENVCYTNTSALMTTRLQGESTSFYIIRHSNYIVTQPTSYEWQAATSQGNITVPQLGGSLTLHGRDSKFHVTDYDLGGINLIYSTAEIFTWRRHGSKSVLVLYGGEDETHEFVVDSSLGNATAIEGSNVRLGKKGATFVVQWDVIHSRQALHFGEHLDVYLLWRNEAYQYWVIDLPAPEPLGLHASPSRTNSSVIVKAGYLLRNASISENTLHLTGDVNTTSTVELISAPPGCCSDVLYNGNRLQYISNTNGRVSGVVPYIDPKLAIAELESLEWRYFDSLPEVQPTYDDDLWTLCNRTSSNNPRNLTTPTSLYSSDYGYHAGSVLYRGHFTANGEEKYLYLSTQGGYAYGHSVWLNSTYLGSWQGNPAIQNYNQTLRFPQSLQEYDHYVLTILVDNLRLDLNFELNTNIMKSPRGLLDYDLSGHDSKSDVSWKITGNLGGEQYRDHSRGPLNEGSTFVERQGYHLPGALNSTKAGWQTRTPQEGLSAAGVGLFATTFSLDYPQGYDIPTSVVFTNSTAVDENNKSGAFRIQLFVNGWQFGKYINNIGPQTEYPIPEGVLNHHGENYLAITFWALEENGAKLDGIELQSKAVVQKKEHIE